MHPLQGSVLCLEREAVSGCQAGVSTEVCTVICPRSSKGDIFVWCVIRGCICLHVLIKCVCFSVWQQDVDEADTSAICNKAVQSPRSVKPPPTRKWTPLLCQILDRVQHCARGVSICMCFNFIMSNYHYREFSGRTGSASYFIWYLIDLCLSSAFPQERLRARWSLSQPTHSKYCLATCARIWLSGGGSSARVQVTSITPAQKEGWWW